MHRPSKVLYVAPIEKRDGNPCVVTVVNAGSKASQKSATEKRCCEKRSRVASLANLFSSTRPFVRLAGDSQRLLDEERALLNWKELYSKSTDIKLCESSINPVDGQ